MLKPPRLFCGVLGYLWARGSLGPSSASASLRFLSALAAIPIEISNRMIPVHMYRKSEVQMVVRMPSVPRMARILAVMVLVSYGVLACCVYVAGHWCFLGVFGVLYCCACVGWPWCVYCSSCASVFEAGGALFFAPACGDHVVVFKQGVDGSDGCWPGDTVGDYFCPFACRCSTISIRCPWYSPRYSSWCHTWWVPLGVACA